MKAVCFTGHRPEKLFASRDQLSLKLALLKRQLRLETERAIEEGYTEFISGMARGIDIIAAEIVLYLKQRHPQIRLVCVLPFAGQATRFSQSWQLRHTAVLDQCDESLVVSPAYSRGCFAIRNRYMVDRSDRVIAVYNGGGGGTANTVSYAERQGKEVVRIDPNALFTV